MTQVRPLVRGWWMLGAAVIVLAWGTVAAEAASARTVPGARIAAVSAQVSWKVAIDRRSFDTEYLKLTFTTAAPVTAQLRIHFAFGARSPGGVWLSPNSGYVTVRAGARVGSAVLVMTFAPLVGNQSIALTCSGVTAACVPSPTAPAFIIHVTSRFGPGPSPGYWMATRLGSVYSFQAPYHGQVTHPPDPIVGMAESAGGTGYWMADSLGHVYALGVPYHGGYSGTPPSPIVAIAADPATGGYWLFSRSGAVYGYGGAPNFGQGSHLAGPVAAAGAAPDGQGYWIVTTNGFVYGYGPGASYYGGASAPASPVVSFAPDLHTGGYWLVTAKGVVYAFHAPNYGSVPSGQNVTGITSDPATSGYWVSSANGGLFGFGAKFYGSAIPYHPASPIIAVLGR